MEWAIIGLALVVMAGRNTPARSSNSRGPGSSGNGTGASAGDPNSSTVTQYTQAGTAILGGINQLGQTFGYDSPNDSQSAASAQNDLEQGYQASGQQAQDATANEQTINGTVDNSSNDPFSVDPGSTDPGSSDPYGQPTDPSSSTDPFSDPTSDPTSDPSSDLSAYT